MGRCEKCGHEPLDEGKCCPSCASSNGITAPPKLSENILIGADGSSQIDNQYPVGYAYSGRYKIERSLVQAEWDRCTKLTILWRRESFGSRFRKMVFGEE